VSAIYAEFKRVDNAQVRRERDGRRGRELASLLAAGLPVAMALLAYTGLHLETVRIGYKIERQRAEFEPLAEIAAQNHLRIDTTRQREYLVTEIDDALEHLLHRMPCEHRNSGAR